MKAIKHNEKWTSEEVDYLIELASGKLRLNVIANRLGRTEQAVQRMMERVGCSNRHILTGTVSANMLSHCLGVDIHTVINHIKKKNLPGRKFRFKLNNSKCQPYYIDVENFWKWAYQNRHEFDWRKYERNSLLPEPDWIEDAIKESKKNIPEKSGSKWTSKEEKEVWFLYYNKGLPQKEIAKMMGRSVSSIERKLKRLREENNKLRKKVLV